MLISQRNTYMQIVTLLSQLSKDQMESQLFTQLEVKESAILHKYMTAIGHQIQGDDAGKCKIKRGLKEITFY